MLRIIAFLSIMLMSFSIVTANDDDGFQIPPFPEDIDPAMVIGQVGEQTITIADFVQRLRFERLRYYDALVNLVEQAGEEALNINDPNNQFAAPVRDLLTGLVDDDEFPTLVYDTMIIEKLYGQEAALRGLDVTDCQIEELWALRVGIQDPMFDCENPPEGFAEQKAAHYDEAATFAAMTPEQVDATVMAVIQYQLVLDDLREEAPIELQPARSSRHIRVQTEPLAQEIYERLQDGESFDELQAQYTMDQGVTGNRGELGLIERGDTVPQFDEAAFSAPVGEVVGPIQTNFGYHVIRVNAQEPIAAARQIVVESERDATQVIDLLNGGAGFGELAQRFSIDEATRQRGGDLGAFTRDRVIPELGEAVFSQTEPGLIDPVQTELGYHVIEILAFEAAGLVDVAHILLETEEEAQDVIASISAGADFNELATERSIDPSAAGTRGDTLSLFSNGQQRGLYIFEETALPIERLVFAEGAEAGDIFAPVEVFGDWFVIRLEEIGERQPQPPDVDLARRFYVRDWETEQFESDRILQTNLWRVVDTFELLPSQYDARLAGVDEQILQIRAEIIEARRGAGNLIDVLGGLSLPRAESTDGQ